MGKSPSKQTPSLTKSLKKKRERVRRATADPANLKKEIEHQQNESDDDSEDSQYDEVNVHIAQHSDHENGGDYTNKYVATHKRRKSNINYNERKFVCNQKPETMTISNLKQWLNKNNIDYATNERKAVYVALVNRYCIVSDYNKSSYQQKKRMVSPHKKKKKFQKKKKKKKKK